MPFAPSFSIARSISRSASGTLFIGSEATKAGKWSGCLATISAMPSFARRASSGDWSCGARNSIAGSDKVRICLYPGKRSIMRRRASRSHSTGMCSQRLIWAASVGLCSAIAFTRSKNACGKMCGKMSSLRFGFMSAWRLDSQLARGIVPQIRPFQIARLGPALEPGDEARHRLEHHAGLVAVGRVPAVCEAQELDRAAGLPRDRLELRHRPVLVVEPLDREHRAMYARQDLLDVPAPEVRVQPDVVPPPERPRRIGVIAAELLREVGLLEGGPRLRDALHADVFDENMRSHEHQPLDAVVHRSVDKRDRSAVGMAHENRLADAEPLEQLRQDLERFDVHVVDRAWSAQHFGLTVAVARVDHRGAPGGRSGPLREIAPHRDRAQSFVEKDQSRRVPISAGNFLNFELAALNGVEGMIGFLGQTRLSSVLYRIPQVYRNRVGSCYSLSGFQYPL